MTPQEVLAQYRSIFADIAEPVVIRRYSGAGDGRTRTEAQVLARVMGYQPRDLVGAVVQGDVKVIALNDPSAAVPGGMVALAALLPLGNSDKVMFRGRERAIKAVDDNTRRVAGVLIALELQVAG